MPRSAGDAVVVLVETREASALASVPVAKAACITTTRKVATPIQKPHFTTSFAEKRVNEAITVDVEQSWLRTSKCRDCIPKRVRNCS
jgi:hypothetical protein